MTGTDLRFAVALYQALLRFYPAGFRTLFAADMAADVAQGYEDACKHGRTAAMRFLWAAYADLAASWCRQVCASDRLSIVGWSIGAATALWGAAIWILAREWAGGPAREAFYLQLFVFFAVVAAVAWAGVGRATRPGDSRLLR